MKPFAWFLAGVMVTIPWLAVAQAPPRLACFATCAEHDAYAQRCGCGNACMKLRLDGGAP